MSAVRLLGEAESTVATTWVMRMSALGTCFV